MQVSFRMRDRMADRLFWRWSATKEPAWRIQAAAFVVMLLVLWREQGIAVALVTVALVPPMMAAIYLRMRQLEVVADADRLRATNWFSTHQWRWEDVATFDFAPTRFVRLYKGRVILNGGRAHVLSALVGSTTGRLERDEEARAFVIQLCAELQRHR
jgi:Bacterial PH domain